MRGLAAARRTDIDGLRAVAVVLVTCFHLDMPGFRRGFLGVDIFFVISGYLITTIISRDIAAGTFSIVSFYVRRSRRILPALFGVLLFTSAVSCYYMLPRELTDYARSLLSAVLFYSNIYFWLTTNYFDQGAQSNPLLHTWSLAVEEQFYIIFPLFLLLFARRRQMLVAAVSIAAAASFGWWLFASVESPPSAFYLPFSRAWELLAGGILALEIVPGIGMPGFNGAWAREWASAAGLLLIGIAACFPTGYSSPVVPATVLACAGALLLLAAGRGYSSFVGRMLSIRPFVYLGIISYSVYLWHWPLVVFSKMGFLTAPHRGLYELDILTLSVVLGALSWQFIERPFRWGALGRRPSLEVFGTAAGAMSLFVCLAIVILSSSGFPKRFPNDAVNVAQLMNEPQLAQLGRCFITPENRFEDYEKRNCTEPDEKKKNYLLLGDSHAAFLWFGLSSHLRDVHLLQATSAGCNPGVDTAGDNNCRRLMAYVYGDFLPSHHVDAVFLSARWQSERYFDELQDTMAWYASHHVKVFIVGPVMEYDAPLPRLLAYSIAFHDPTLPRRHQRNDLAAVNRELKHIAENEWHVPYISLMDVECAGVDGCITYAGPVPMLFDNNHLSNAASTMLVGKLIALRSLPPIAANYTTAAR